ncbi:MAG: UDP-N-acetylmuramoyl-tripeptide--D-alanyl-D-alanine ligase, partial [Nocardia sp.]|nr:UDP-N-acetylmuramoyl-tripeptide--D-alanyl-D-alanine ligase [Nocardia sp.]
WGEESVLVPNIEAAVELLAAEVGASDVVLVKASQSVGLWAVAEQLLAEGEKNTGAGTPAPGGTAADGVSTEAVR